MTRKIRKIRFREGKIVTLIGNQGFKPVDATPIGAPYFISLYYARGASKDYFQRRKRAIHASLPEGANSYMTGEKDVVQFFGEGFDVDTLVQAYRIKTSTGGKK